MTEATVLTVAGERPYDVVVGHNLTDRLPAALGPAHRVALIHTLRPDDHRWHRIAGTLELAGIETLTIEVPDAEAAKTVEVAARCWSLLGQAGFTRSDAIIGLGGGAVTDLAGFVAGTWLRGVRSVLIPSTLLGMVDAAVGGKTGINTAEGKNLVGVIHEPAAVLCDLNTLAGLPPADLRAGLAEVVKCGFVADPAILELVEADPAAAARPGSPTLRELVERSIAVKAAVVAADLREATSTGTAVGREQLNYGHTFAHAIERVEGYRWRHGDAVSVGLVFVAALARLAGRLDAATADRHRSVLAALGLPVSCRAGVFDELLAAMRVDKKTRGATLRFVILEALARPAILAGPSEELLRAAYAEVAKGLTT